MEITLNGQPRQVTDGTTMLELLTKLKIKGPFAVELNQQICPKAKHTETILNPNDILEIVTIVGGG